MKNKNLVVSVDTFVYGIHCPKYINISSGVNRAILAAISDLSAMAAKPYCIFISITLNKNKISKKSLHRFLMSRKVKEYENLLIKFENK